MPHRGKSGLPPIGRFTHRRTLRDKETNITLQDGCFGMATLMRIGALFIPSAKPFEDPSSQKPPPTPNPTAKGSHQNAALQDRKERRAKKARQRASIPELPPEIAPSDLPAAEELILKQMAEAGGRRSEQGEEPSEADQSKLVTREASTDLQADKPACTTSNPQNSALSETDSIIDQKREVGNQSEIEGKAGETGEVSESGALQQASRIAGEAVQGARTMLAEDDLGEKGDLPLTPKVSALSESAEGVELPASEGRANTSMDTPTKHPERQPIDRATQFSIEVVRCRAVCPDWQDSALVDGSFRSRPDTLVLGIPHALLQLPVSNPASQPLYHPVQVNLSDL